MKNISKSIQLDDKSIFETEKLLLSALKVEGFGVLTVLDVPKIIKEKLNIDQYPYKIFGICNPQLAHQALQVEPNIGILLPCKVVIYQKEDENFTTVTFFDPKSLFANFNNAKLLAIADKVSEKIEKVINLIK